jgi:serine/threonine-protein kinase
MWGLNKNPVDRPKDADEFIAALEAARASIVTGADGERTASIPPVLPPVAPVIPAAPPTGPIPPEQRRRDPWPWVALLLALLIAGGAVAAVLLTRTHKVTVPNVVHEQLGTASSVLQNAGFTVGVLNVTSSQPSGIVIREDPPGGTKAKQGSKVSLTVSSGPGTAVLPGVLGDPLAQAKRTIRAAHFRVGRIIHQPSTVYSAGEVINTDPAAGANLPVGTKVDLFVSTGPPKVTVPDVIGETEGQAKSDLQTRGFTVHATPETSTTAAAGTVINQSPTSGAQEPQGTTVTIVVAKAPTTAPVPNVQGQTASAATRTLKQSGFNVARRQKKVTDKTQNGIVLSESPSNGSTAKKGSTVTITVGHYVAPSTPTTPTTTSTTPTTPAVP